MQSNYMYIYRNKITFTSSRILCCLNECGLIDPIHTLYPLLICAISLSYIILNVTSIIKFNITTIIGASIHEQILQMCK